MATFGGQLGVAEKAIKGRKNRLDEEEAKATNASHEESPKEDKKEKPAARPPMSKKWYE